MNNLYRSDFSMNSTNLSTSLHGQTESGDETASQTSSGSPVQARLVADGVSVLYSAPAPPLIPPQQNLYSHNNQNGFESVEEEERDEFDDFIEKVKSASPIRRCETSSASLPVSWYSSRDSLISPSAQPNSLQSEDYAPQIMTEDYVASPEPSTQSSLSSSAFYSTFLPDRDFNSSEVGLDLDGQVGIVENEYTIVEYSDPSCQEDEDVYWAERREGAFTASTEDNREVRVEQRSWKSNSGLADMKELLEKKTVKNNQYVKYASDSNICEMSGAPENGLRNIPKDKDFSSREGSESSEQSGFEDHIYCRIDEVQAPKYSAAGYDESGFFSYDQYGYYDNVIPEEPSDFEDSVLEPDHVSRVPVRSPSDWQIHQKSVSQHGVDKGVSMMVNQRPEVASRSVAADLERLASRRPVNGDRTVKDHVTLITIGSSDPPPPTSTKPGRLNLPFNQEPRFGSVHDLRRAFEKGIISEEARKAASVNPNLPNHTNPASSRVKEDLVILTFSGILSSLWLG